MPVGTVGGVLPQPEVTLGVAAGAVNDRHRPVVELVDEVGDVDGVAGLVDGDRERAGAHRDGCRDPAAAAAGVPVARGPVDHRHGVAVARVPLFAA